MGEAKSRTSPEPRGAAPADRWGWLPWLAWGWVVLLFLAVVAEVSGNADLRLALDFSRHLR